MICKIKDYKEFISGLPDEGLIETLVTKIYIREHKKFPLFVTFDEDALRADLKNKPKGPANE